MKDLLQMYEDDLLRAIQEFGGSEGAANINDLDDEIDLFEPAIKLEKKGLLTRK